MSTLKPLWDRIIIEAKAAETETSSGIVLPDSKEKPMEWIVIAINENSSKTSVKVWDIVVYKKYSVTEYKMNWKEYLILDAEDVMAKLV